MQVWVKRFVVGFFVLFSIAAQAVSVVVTGPQMQLMVSSAFPLKQTIGSWEVTFTDPEPAFYAATQKMAVEVSIHIREGNKVVDARGKIQGVVEYHAQSQQIHLIKPTLESFHVISGDAALKKNLESSIGKTIGQSLPVIVLVDIKQLGLSSWITPSSVSVVNEGVSVSF